MNPSLDPAPPPPGLFQRTAWRLMPLLFTSYVVAYIDRINVGFAKLHLREALGVDEQVFGSVYGLGAGLFFLGYFLFEVPSNLIMQRVGARLWIARIMVVWGLVSGAMMFVGSAQSFYAMRFLLGVAEAGFFPGVLLYLTAWFPARERAKTVAMFAVGRARRRDRRLAAVGRDPRPRRRRRAGRVAVAVHRWKPCRRSSSASSCSSRCRTARPTSPGCPAKRSAGCASASRRMRSRAAGRSRRCRRRSRAAASGCCACSTSS